MSPDLQSKDPINMTSTIKISNFLIPEQFHFNGSNLSAFSGAFTLLLHTQGLRYLVDSAVTKPQGADEKNDKFVLYQLLVMNISDTAKNIVAKHDPDGKQAWLALNTFYKDTNTAVVMNLAVEHSMMRWAGGDKDSFDDWISRFQGVTNKLLQAGLKYEDWQLAIMVLSKIPREYSNNNVAVDLLKPSDLKSDAVIEQIRSRLMLDKNQDDLALYTQTKPAVVTT
ncbi:hypothetical protein EMMF5_006610, partial [Cystobasidiomycetes sp. EMM_F5]